MQIADTFNEEICCDNWKIAFKLGISLLGSAKECLQGELYWDLLSVCEHKAVTLINSLTDSFFCGD